MRPDVDAKLAHYVEHHPDTNMSATVNEALTDYFEDLALQEYQQWDADAPAAERIALDAFAAHDDAAWAAG